MKINNSIQTKTTQETQESQNITKGPKGGGASPRAGNASADSVEMISTAKGKAETSGQRQLTADEQAMAGKIDPKNYTSLHSGTDPRAALESKPFDKYKQPSPRGTNTMPNGQTPSGPDLSKYTTPTNGAPPSLKESMDQIGSSGEKLKGLVGNATDMFNDPLKFKGNHSQGGPGSLGKSMISDENAPSQVEIEKAKQAAALKAMGITPAPATTPASTPSTPSTPPPAAGGEGKMAKIKDAVLDAFGFVRDVTLEEVMPPGGGEILTILDAPNTVKKVTGRPADLADGFKAILGGQPLSGSQGTGGGVKYVPEEMDNNGGRDGSLVDSLFNGGTILQGVTGKGQGGGEVVNPNPEATGGGRGAFDDHGASKARLGQDNADYLIGQPAQGDEDGFNGLSGTGGGQRGGNIDNEDGSGYEGGQRTEEPGEIKLTPGGDGQLSHLIKK